MTIAANNTQALGGQLTYQAADLGFVRGGAIGAGVTGSWINPQGIQVGTLHIRMTIDAGTSIRVDIIARDDQGAAFGYTGIQVTVAGTGAASELNLVFSSNHLQQYYDVAGVGSAALTNRIPVIPGYGFRVVLTRTAGAGATTLNEMSMAVSS